MEEITNFQFEEPTWTFKDRKDVADAIDIGIREEESKISTARSTIRKYKQEMKEWAFTWIEGCADEVELRRVVQYMYWTHRVSKRELEKASDLKVESYHYQITCPICDQNKVDLSATSHYDLDQQAKHYKQGMNKGEFLGDTFLCTTCIARATERHRKQQEFLQQKQASLPTIEELRAMPYQEYLQTEHWQLTRKRALRRAGYRCQLCNETGRLDVHHRTCQNRGNEFNSDVTVLCRECHAKFHGKEVE